MHHVTSSCCAQLQISSSSCSGFIYSRVDLKIHCSLCISPKNCRAPKIPGLSVAAGTFWDNSGAFYRTFASPLGSCSSFFAELNAILLAIDFTFDKGLTYLCIESDSVLAWSYFWKDYYDLSWQLRSHWCSTFIVKCYLWSSISLIFSIEAICLLISLLIWVLVSSLHWWITPPAEICSPRFHDRMGYPN